MEALEVEGVMKVARSFGIEFAKVAKNAFIFELTIVSTSAMVAPLSFLLSDGNGKGGMLNMAAWGEEGVMIVACWCIVRFAKAGPRIEFIFKSTSVSTSAMVTPPSGSLSVAGWRL